MLKVGITGGIGAGKSIVAKVFEKLGVPVYYADARAKALMVTNENLVNQIKATFGEDIYKENELDRAKLAQVVFNNTSKLEQLNKLVHPAVKEDFIAWANKHKTAPYVLEEAAILFESGSYKLMDKVITVICPQDIRIKRVMERDGVTREAVLARMANQWKEEEKMALSDFIVQNDGEKLVIPQVLAIHRSIIGQ